MITKEEIKEIVEMFLKDFERRDIPQIYGDSAQFVLSRIIPSNNGTKLQTDLLELRIYYQKRKVQ